MIGIAAHHIAVFGIPTGKVAKLKLSVSHSFSLLSV